MIREELLALADELEGMDCRTCLADGTKDCRDLPCEEAVARAASRRIREVVEHDACEEAATTVSAYDLLSEDERKAIAWVREHGGLGEVEKRLMPEGMEWLLDVWPKWSNGEYCKFGDWWKAGKYGKLEPQQLSRLAFFTPEQLRELGQDEGENFGYEWNFMRPSDTTYRPDKVEPPAPKVLDADGVEILVGDTVYHVKDGSDMTVYGIEGEWLVVSVGGRVRHDIVTHRAPVLAADGKPLEVGQTVWRDDGEMLEVLYLRPDGLVDCCGEIERPERLTHDRPVLDADGVPCREGDEVWEVRSHRRREIIGTHYRDYRTGEPLILCDGDDEIPIPATCVTHTNPEIDTWERLEHDAEKTVCEYFGANYDCSNCPLEPDRCDEEAKKDIISRAKKLAEKESR